ncbi:hypothetical protein FKM82_011988, partial [Ascaphus truei]
ASSRSLSLPIKSGRSCRRTNQRPDFGLRVAGAAAVVFVFGGACDSLQRADRLCVCIVLRAGLFCCVPILWLAARNRKMATMIFVDQENGDLATNISAKDRVKLSKFSKSLSTKGQTSYPGKVFSTSKAVPKPSRKALGNVNQQVENQKVVTTLKGDLKGHLPAAQKYRV